MKPYYARDGITIYCGDCVTITKGIIPDNHIDLTMTSPPYDLVDEDMITRSGNGLRDYQGYEWDFVSVAKQLYRVTAKGGVVVWVVGDATVSGSETGSSFRQALYFMKCGFNLHDTMIYRKEFLAFPDSNRYYQSFEYMFIFSVKQIKTFNPIKDRINIGAGRKISGLDRKKDGTLKKRSGLGQCYPTHSTRFNAWLMANAQRDVTDCHPAIFPEALARDHIISWSNPGDLIFDPFLGSGTTLKMAQQLGRRAIGIEISEEYCAIAVERLRQPSFFSIPDKPKEQPIEQLPLSLK